MNRPLPRNLERIYKTIGKDAADRMHSGHSFVLDGIEFVSGYIPESTAERFYVVKSAELLDLYDDFLARHEPRRIFELGIAEGGSTAMMALRPDLELLVAIDNETNRLPALDEFITARGLTDRVRVHFGIDQSDREAMTAIVAADLADGPLDLVIDDASHQYDLTKASFDILFPHLRPGGWYLVEDWSQRLKAAEGVRRKVVEKAATDPATAQLLAEAGRGAPPEGSDEPLERLGLEWVVAMGAWPGAIDRVEMNDQFIAARRGAEGLDPHAFRLDDFSKAEPFVGLLRAPRES